MKRSRPAPLALVLATLLVLTGCPSQFSDDPKVEPVQRLIAANVAYTATVRTLTQLRTAGKIDDATALRMEAGMKVADGFLADAKRAVTTGDRLTFDRTLTAFEAALADLDRTANTAKPGATHGT